MKHLLVLLRPFVPILIFILFFVGSGVFYTLQGIENGFSMISPNFAIMIAIAVAFFLVKGSFSERLDLFLQGMGHKDILTMCLVFLLAGAFSEVTKSIGSLDSFVQLSLYLIPPKFLLIGLFLGSAFISTAIGTSMGVIATLAPIAVSLGALGAFPTTLGAGVIIGGAMFGDNLSLISDTTIASVVSQEANMAKKFKLNAILALIASVITIGILFWIQDGDIYFPPGTFYLQLIIPYFFLLTLALLGFHVFLALFVSLIFSFILGNMNDFYSLSSFSQDCVNGFSGMQEIFILSLLVGGLSGLLGKDPLRSMEALLHVFEKKPSKRLVQFFIAFQVSLFDIFFANNTIAILFAGETTKELSKKHKIPPHLSAVWLDTFSCVFQGLIPWGAQILLASSIAKVAPTSIVPYIFYCPILGLVAIFAIAFVFNNPPYEKD